MKTSLHLLNLYLGHNTKIMDMLSIILNDKRNAEKVDIVGQIAKKIKDGSFVIGDSSLLIKANLPNDVWNYRKENIEKIKVGKVVKITNVKIDKDQEEMFLTPQSVVLPWSKSVIDTKHDLSKIVSMPFLEIQSLEEGQVYKI